jgi:hypothetical protein
MKSERPNHAQEPRRGVAWHNNPGRMPHELVELPRSQAPCYPAFSLPIMAAGW